MNDGPRAAFLERLLAATRDDPRIVGLLDYGSGGFGRADEWSDVDVAVFVRDADLDAFAAGWREWAAQFGTLLLAYRGRYQHPWVIYDTAPLPLRVDFDLWPESRVVAVETWANSPTRLEDMLLYEGSGGALTAAVQRIVGQSLAPADPEAAFQSLCGDFWYFLLYVYSKLQRGEGWVARLVFHGEVLDALFCLLRLEAGAVEQWRESPAALHAERVLSPARLAQIEACVPAAGAEGLRSALPVTARLGRSVCAALAARRSWDWPRTLAERTEALLA